MTEEQLSALLRTIKRHEQPPAEYFDGLLRDLHRRQRAELLRQPLWRIGVERIQTFFGEHSMSSVSYAGAMAAIVVFGVVTIGVALPGKFESREEPVMAKNTAVPSTPFTLQSSAPGRMGAGLTTASQTSLFPSGPSATAQLPPRYIIDARPVLYDNPPVSF